MSGVEGRESLILLRVFNYLHFSLSLRLQKVAEVHNEACKVASSGGAVTAIGRQRGSIGRRRIPQT